MLYGTAYLAYVVLDAKSMTGSIEIFSLGVEWWVGLIVAVVLCPLVCIRRQERFVAVFIVANVVMMVALAGFTVPKLLQQKNPFRAPIWPKSYPDVLRLVGISLFAFEGYGLVIPAQQQLKHKKSYSSVLTLCTASVFVFYALFGILTSNEGGRELTEAVTFRTLVDDLDCHSHLAYGLSVSLIAGLVAGYLLITYPSLRIAEWALQSVVGSRKLWARNLLRVGLVLGTICVAVIWHAGFANVIVFMGFFICVPLVLLVPAYSHLVLVASGWLDRALDALLLILGVALMAAGVLYCCSQGGVLL